MNKIAFITGASKGIGRATSLRMAVDLKYRVIAVSRNEAQLQSLKAEAFKAGGTIIPLAVDLLEQDFNPVLRLLREHSINSIDVLINNAGLLVNKPFEELQFKDLSNSYAVNAIAPLLFVQHLLPYLKKAEQAHIVNISSMGGFQGAAKFPGLVAYSSAKAALVCITECLAEELKSTTVHCNCLCLGSVDTEMLKAAFPAYTAKISADEMGKYIAQFADSAYTVMNGKVIPVALSTP